MREVIPFFKSEDVEAKYEIVDGHCFAHIETQKWNKDIKHLVINLLLDFVENVNPVIYAYCKDDKHEKFLHNIGFLLNEGSVSVDGKVLKLYECRDWRE